MARGDIVRIMFEITEYYVVHNDNAELLTGKINEMVRQGWQPFGGISTISTTANAFITYAQAMVKYAEKS